MFKRKVDRSSSIVVQHSNIQMDVLIRTAYNIIENDCLDTCFERDDDKIEMTFRTALQAADFIKKFNGTEFAGEKVNISPVEEDVIKIKIFGLPPQLSNEIVAGFMSDFGKVLSVKCQYWEQFPSISTGARIVEILVLKEIPNFVPMGEYEAICNHWNIPRVCRRCFKPGHLANQCRIILCRNCLREGHLEKSCIDTCRFCREGNHTFSKCPETAFDKVLERYHQRCSNPGTNHPVNNSTIPKQMDIQVDPAPKPGEPRQSQPPVLAMPASKSVNTSVEPSNHLITSSQKTSQPVPVLPVPASKSVNTYVAPSNLTFPPPRKSFQPAKPQTTKSGSGYQPSPNLQKLMADSANNHGKFWTPAREETYRTQSDSDQFSEVSIPATGQHSKNKKMEKERFR